MKYAYCVLAMLCLWANIGQAQKIRPLAVGDTVPDITFNHLVNHTSSSAKLSDFKGKLVILDFWSSWCSACIGLFPHMDSLQEKFKGSLKVILFNTKSNKTQDDELKIRKILAGVASRTGKRVGLPVVYNNEKLDAYFPCIAIPHEIWIDPQGKVIGITSASEVTASNIQKVLNGEPVFFHLKKDFLDYNRQIPLFVNGNGGEGKEMLFRSLLTGYIEGVGGGSGVQLKDGKIVRHYVHNASLLSLVKEAYSNIITCHNNRIIILSANRHFNIAYDDTIRYKHTYCYELMVPPTDEAAIRSYMQNDLKRYFNISARKDTQQVKCLVVTKDEACQLAVANGSPQLDIEKESRRKYIHNYPLPSMINILNRLSNTPIIDETNTSSTFSIELPYNINNINELKASFHKIGLKLIEAQRALEVVVVTDR